jgi:hypothetical protein
LLDAAGSLDAAVGLGRAGSLDAAGAVLDAAGLTPLRALVGDLVIAS